MWKLTWQDEVQTNPLERTEDTTVLCTGPHILQIQGWPCCASSPEPKDGSRCATTGNASWKGRNEEAAPSSHAAWIAVQGEGPAHKHTCTHTQTRTHISFKIRFYNSTTAELTEPFPFAREIALNLPGICLDSSQGFSAQRVFCVPLSQGRNACHRTEVSPTCTHATKRT